MSTKRNSPAQSPATPITEHRQTGAKQPPALSKFARQFYAQVKERLESEFESFLEHSAIEEQRLMIEIFNDHTNRCSVPRSPGEYEITLYSAIERQLSGSVCVVLPNDDLVPKVEAFIAGRERRRKPQTSSTWKRDTDEEIRNRLDESFRSDVELFARDAGLPSLGLMRSILARWSEIERDPELARPANQLAVAAEIELDRYRADIAAEEVKAS